MAADGKCDLSLKRRNLIIQLVPQISLCSAPMALLTSALSAKNSYGQQVNDIPIQDGISNSAKRNSLPLILPETLADLSRLSSQPSKWMVSEKLDGVRAYWSGKQLYFRSGRLINAPSWFTKDFPDFELDGELWMGRGQFEKLSAAVRRQQTDDSEWRQIQYCLFELPHGEGDFAARYSKLKAYVSQSNIAWLKTIEQQVFTSTVDIQRHFDQLIRIKAEGIVLHDKRAVFEEGRSKHLFKFKPYFDAEAVVLKHIPGTGKLAGKMGALLVENRDGVRFKLGSGFNDDLRRAPPAIGSWISYRYRDLTGGSLPRFATYLRSYEAD